MTDEVPDLTQPRTAENLVPLLRWLAEHFRPLAGKLPDLPEAERQAVLVLLTELADGIERKYEKAAPCLFPDGPPIGRPKLHVGHSEHAVRALQKATAMLGPGASKQRVEEEAASLLGLEDVKSFRDWLRAGKK